MTALETVENYVEYCNFHKLDANDPKSIKRYCIWRCQDKKKINKPNNL